MLLLPVEVALELELEAAPLVTGVAGTAEPGSFLMELDGEAEGGLTLPDINVV